MLLNIYYKCYVLYTSINISWDKFYSLETYRHTSCRKELYRWNPRQVFARRLSRKLVRWKKQKGGCCNARKCSWEMLLHAQLQQASNNRFAPSARNGKCISVDRAQTKGRTFARGLSLSRFLPFRAVLPSGVSFHLPPSSPPPVLLSRVTLARQIPVLELSKD